MDVKVFTRDGRFHVLSPYDVRFVAGAKRLGGRWDGETWRFDPAREPEVMALIQSVYGVAPISDADALSAIADKLCKVKRTPAGHYMITLPAIPHSMYSLTIDALLAQTAFKYKDICGMYNIIAACHSPLQDAITVGTLRDMMLSGQLTPVNYAE